MKEEGQEKRKIIESYISAYNAFDVDGMLRCVHQDIEFKNFSASEVNAATKGIDEFRNLAEKSKALFSSRRETITSFESKDDSAKVGIEFEAVLAVDMKNGMKAGEVLHLFGRSEFKFRDGKLYQIEDHS
jgi:ketosteroid isomerase-like protein